MNDDDKMCFLMSALALALVCTVQGEEKQHSARWNRTRSAEEAILRLCDLYKPDGLNSIRLNKVWAVLDGPVTEVLRQHKDELFAGVSDESYK